MAVTMDVSTYTYKGTQELVYTNNSQDTLEKYTTTCSIMLFSLAAMDAPNIKDPDGRMVSKLKYGDKEIKESRIKNLNLMNWFYM
jgi:hypothetical protein